MISLTPRVALTIMIASLTSVGLANSARAIDITSNGTTATYDPNEGGITSWVTDGSDHMWFYTFAYRLASEPNATPLWEMDYLGDLTTSDSTSVLYELAGVFQLELTFTVDDAVAGDQQALLKTDVSLTNLSGGDLDLSLFQYVDYDVDFDESDDTVEIQDSGAKAVQSDDAVHISETIISPSASHHQVALFEDDLLGQLLDSNSAFDLNDDGSLLGPNDVTFAFQWDLSLEDNEIFTLGKDMRVVPEPATMALFVAGLTLVAPRRGRRQS